MQPFADRVAAGDTLLCDGGLGTMLFEAGLDPGSCHEALALTRPELLTTIAAQYLDAGSDIVETNTFGASPLKLSQYDLEGQTEEINRAAVDAVRSAVARGSPRTPIIVGVRSTAD